MHCKTSWKSSSGETNVHIIFVGDTKGYLNIYTNFVLSRSSVEGEELLELIMLEVLNL